LHRLAPGAVLELVGFGLGSNSHLVWASPIGPTDRLRSLSESNPVGRVTIVEDPFVNLNPRTTAVAGAMRAFNAFAPIQDELTYHRAARSYQVNTAGLIFALALVAQGELDLPAGVSNIFAAVTSLLPSQQLYAAYVASHLDCSSQPEAPRCVVLATLPLDPQIFPARAVEVDRPYSTFQPFQSASSAQRNGYVLTGANTARVFSSDLESIPAEVTSLPNGGVRISRADGLPISEFQTYEFGEGGQIRLINQTLAYHVRATNGPGGNSEQAFSFEQRVVLGDDPEVVVRTIPASAALPNQVADGTLPAVLHSRVPTLLGKTFVLPLITDFGPAPETTHDGIFGYDLHVFSTSSAGTALRSGAGFSYVDAGSDGFSITIGTVTATFKFVNEEEDSVWRVRAHVVGDGREALVDGLMIEGDNSLVFDSSLYTGVYKTEINGHICSGPYGALTDLEEYPGCLPGTHYEFLSNGSVLGAEGSSWGTWEFGTGGNSGNLLMNRVVGGVAIQRRAWQKIWGSGDTFWLLENFNTRVGSGAAPAVSFTPTQRLSRAKRVP
jgi:hypothetical protein